MVLAGRLMSKTTTPQFIQNCDSVPCIMHRVNILDYSTGNPEGTPEASNAYLLKLARARQESPSTIPLRKIIAEAALNPHNIGA